MVLKNKKIKRTNEFEDYFDIKTGIIRGAIAQGNYTVARYELHRLKTKKYDKLGTKIFSRGFLGGELSLFSIIIIPFIISKFRLNNSNELTDELNRYAVSQGVVDFATLNSIIRDNKIVDNNYFGKDTVTYASPQIQQWDNSVSEIVTRVSDDYFVDAFMDYFACGAGFVNINYVMIKLNKI
ncbi:MAG: hypothetical protein IJZ29_01920 [Clostridia bacterium]|nr:hypothetical protein [Clostridia bacterium]